MGKEIKYECDHCKKRITEKHETRLDINSKTSSMLNCLKKNFEGELYFCDDCILKIKDILEAFIHRRFIIRG